MYELYYNNSLNIIMVAFRFLKYNICVQDDIRNVTSSQNTSSIRRMALALALIKQMLKFENSSKDACDFRSELCIASLAMTCARKFDASLPQAP